MPETEDEGEPPPATSDPTPWLTGVSAVSAVLVPVVFFGVEDPVLAVGMLGVCVLAGAAAVVSGLVALARGRATVITAAALLLAPVPFVGLLAVVMSSGFPGAPGRPVRRGGRPALARVRRVEGPVRPLGTSLAPADRAALAAWWTDAARGEHASVVAFLELADDLARLGAPASLVARARVAAADEVRHAEASFAVAGGFADVALAPEPLDPGPRPEPGLLELAVASAVEGAFLEGCAAREAAAAADEAVDEGLAGLLRTIAREEAEHAALGADVARWAAEVGGWPVSWAVSAAWWGLRAPRAPTLPAGWGVARARPFQAEDHQTTREH